MTSRLLVDKIEGKTTSGSIQMPQGHVIQTVDGSDGTQTTSTSSSFVASNVAVTITPKFSTSKIYIAYSMSLYNATNQAYSKTTLYRGSTNIGDSSWGLSAGGYSTGGHSTDGGAVTIDSPATTSATTYTVYFAPHNGGSGNGTAYANINGVRGQIIAMGIAQ